MKYENLETESKLWNQIKFHNLNALYEKLKPFILGGFEDKPDDKSDYDMFMNINMKKQNCITYMPKHAIVNNGCVIVPCQITQGSLPSVVCDMVDASTVSGMQYIPCNITLGSLFIGANTMVSEFSQAVVENNEGFMYGDKISYIFANQSMNASQKIPQTHMWAKRVTLDQNNYELLNTDDTDSFVEIQVLNGYLAVAFDHTNIPYAFGSSDSVIAWIHSRLDQNGKLLVSTAQFIDGVNPFSLDGDRLYALPTYGFDNNPPFIEPGDLETAVVPDGAPAVVEMKTLDTRDLSGYITGTVTSWTSSDTSVATVSNGVVSSLDYTYTGSTECPFKYTDITVVTSNNDTYKFKIKVIPRNVVLTDGNPYLNNENFVAENVSYTRTYSENIKDNWQCFYVPFDIEITDELLDEFEFAKLYMISYMDENNNDEIDDTDPLKMMFNKLSVGKTLHANKPYYVKPKNACTKTFESTNVVLKAAANGSVRCCTIEYEYSLVGINETTNIKGMYSMNTKGQFVYCKSDANIKANRWYMKVTPRAEYVD